MNLAFSTRTIKAIFLITLVTVPTAAVIFFYCEIFQEFGFLAKNRLTETPLLTFFVTPLFFWVSACLCRNFAPNAAGSGLLRMKLATHELEKNPNSYKGISHLLSLRIIIVGAVSSLISTLGGGALGREAISVHMTGSAFVMAANKLKKISSKIKLETWLFVGGGIGFAVAFLAPIAGFVYIVEKSIQSKKSFSSNLKWAVLPLLVVLLMTHEITPIFATHLVDFYWQAELLLLIPFGFFCGLVAFYFNRICIFLYEKFSAIKSIKWHLVPIICGLLVASISFYSGIYSISGGIQTASDVLNSVQPIMSYKEVFGRILNTILSFFSGCAGGLVAPSIAIGAGIGSIFTSLAEISDMRIFILSGMVSVLTPMIGLPFVAIAVIIETSQQPLTSFWFLLLPTFSAFFAAKLMNLIAQKT